MNNWFDKPGAYVLVDGQFGSTGKGLLAGWIAEGNWRDIDVYTTNAGPNSGHTAYFGHRKIMTQQLPVGAVVARLAARAGCLPDNNPDFEPVVYLNAGAVIDPEILNREIEEWQMRNVTVHPNVAVIGAAERRADQSAVNSVAGTGKGVGPAIATKVMRQDRDLESLSTVDASCAVRGWDWDRQRVFVETAQGFSLGLNEPRFYPYVTSRECTVMQAISDARIPAQMVRKVVMCLRTFPIRVGNSPEGGYSGDCYPDQYEMQWSQIGVDKELTTVTKRVRRVFNWSRIQFREACAANRPDVLFVNFFNYLKPAGVDPSSFMRTVKDDYRDVMGHNPECILYGWSPYGADIVVEYP